MPTYQYLCNKCGHQFEEMQRISELPLTECPKCQGEVERVITGGAGIVFKGSGFYITDYKRKENKEGSSSETKSKD